MLLAVCLFGGGCCCAPMCNDCGAPGGIGTHLHHGPHALRHGTLPPPVPAPAVAAPIARYHQLPTHPVFEPQPDYPPLAPLTHERNAELPAPEELPPPKSGEPTPAPLPPEPSK